LKYKYTLFAEGSAKTAKWSELGRSPGFLYLRGCARSYNIDSVVTFARVHFP